MTSKFSIDNRELLQRISSGEAVVGIDFGNLIVRELAAFRLVAMGSEPVAIIDQANLDYLRSGADADVWPPEREEMGDVLLYRHAQPAPVVPEEKLIPNTLSMYAVDAVAAIAEVKGWNACRAATLAAAPQPQNAPQNIPDIIPNELIAAVNRLLDSNGSRGCYSAIKCYDAHIEVERLLAAARQEVKP